jgi:glycosyltransferase involved in cell wall biosynthesis
MDADDKVSARFVLELAQHLTAHARVTVLAPAGPNTQAWEQWGDVRVRRFPYFYPAHAQTLAAGEGMVATMRASAKAKLQAPFFVASQWAMLPDLVRELGVDVVNPHWILPQGLTAALWRRTLAVPSVITAHGADVALLGRMRGGAALGRFIFARADGLVSDSSYLATRTEEIVGHAIPHEAIPMGVATSRFQRGARPEALAAADGVSTILFVGKFVLKKGIPVLLDAVAALKAKGRPVQLLLIGGGPLEADLRARAAALGVEADVRFLGWVKNDELPSYYAAADVVCVPSVQDAHGETEGTPVVLQEAMSCGAVVVASRTSGIVDVVRDGENGWSVPPADATALSAALTIALDAPIAERESLRAAARRSAAEHRWERVAERYYEFFAQALQRTR